MLSANALTALVWACKSDGMKLRLDLWYAEEGLNCEEAWTLG